MRPPSLPSSLGKFVCHATPTALPSSDRSTMSVPDAGLYEQLKQGILKIYEPSTTNAERQSIGEVRTGPSRALRAVSRTAVAQCYLWVRLARVNPRVAQQLEAFKARPEAPQYGIHMARTEQDRACLVPPHDPIRPLCDDAGARPAWWRCGRDRREAVLLRPRCGREDGQDAVERVPGGAEELHAGLFALHADGVHQVPVLTGARGPREIRGRSRGDREAGLAPVVARVRGNCPPGPGAGPR